MMPSTNYKDTLLKLNENLNTLKDREAKYGGNAPLDLLNQISDHKEAITLTRQVITGEINEDEWQGALKPLLLAVNNGQVVNIETGGGAYTEGDVTVSDGGKFVGRDNYETHHHHNYLTKLADLPPLFSSVPTMPNHLLAGTKCWQP